MMKNAKNVTPIFEANMDAAMRSHYRRTGAEAVDPGALPFDRLMTFEQALEGEDDGIEGGADGVGDYEMRQRVIGVRAFLRFLKARGLTMPQIMKQLFASGRAVQDPFFSSLTMTESGLMFSETKAAHSWRVGVLSGQIQLEGMKGYRLPGQKNPESKATYAATAKRTCNRAKKAKQGSFLRKLKTGKENAQGVRRANVEAPETGDFTRKLRWWEQWNGSHESAGRARAGSAPSSFSGRVAAQRRLPHFSEERGA
jgi:hypothetical protein